MLAEGIYRGSQRSSTQSQAEKQDLGADLALLVHFLFKYLPGLRQHLRIVPKLCLQEVCRL